MNALVSQESFPDFFGLLTGFDPDALLLGFARFLCLLELLFNLFSIELGLREARDFFVLIAWFSPIAPHGNVKNLALV